MFKQINLSENSRSAWLLYYDFVLSLTYVTSQEISRIDALTECRNWQISY